MTWTRFTNPPERRSSSPTPRSCSATPTTRAARGRRRRRSTAARPFCVGRVRRPNGCDDNQFSVPTVNPTTGHLYVAFENFNTPDENQWPRRPLDGRRQRPSQGPFFVTPVFDVNFRARARAGLRRARPGGPRPSTRTAASAPTPAAAIVADKRGGAFADDLYLVMADNRNGTPDSTNADVFFFKSTGRRLELDRPDAGEQRPVEPAAGEPRLRPLRRQPRVPGRRRHGNDQCWPWIDIGEQGRLERRVQGPSSRRRLGRARVADEPRTGRGTTWSGRGARSARSRRRRRASAWRPTRR